MDVLKKEQCILVLCEKECADSTFTKELQGYENVTFEVLEKFTQDSQTLLDAVLSDIKPNSLNIDVNDLIAKIYHRIKPGGLLLIRHLSNEDAQKLEFILKTNGFINVTTQKLPSSKNTPYEIKSFKPKYEIGSSTKLTFSKAPIAPTVWKLDDMLEDDDVETIDPDDLLDEEDFKKPDQASLRVCETSGKRKACKDCSCGLADELDAERATQNGTVNTAEAKSSCGSCYLGDAFRCAGCPYLGMPAFKPGEKVQLSDGLLKADT